MSYENAPATKMLATHCACCARPLVDAESVELGIGPDCRKRHGFKAAQAEPSWDAVGDALRGSPLGGESVLPGGAEAAEAAWRLGGLEVRKLANVLVHRIACEQGGAAVPAYVNAVRALGFIKLAGVLAHRLATVVIERDDAGFITVHSPYDEAAVAAFRALAHTQFASSGMHAPRAGRWDAAAKAWRFHPLCARALHATLVRCYPQRLALGPKGLFVLGSAA